jgi:hypothetical protein
MPGFHQPGARGGDPGGTLAWYAVRVRLNPAGEPAEVQGPPLRSKVLVMPCSPPLPSFARGERDRSRGKKVSEGKKGVGYRCFVS